MVPRISIAKCHAQKPISMAPLASICPPYSIGFSRNPPRSGVPEAAGCNDMMPGAGLCLESPHQADADSHHRDTGYPGAKNEVHPPHYRTRVTISQANTRKDQKNTDGNERAANRNEKKAEELPNELERIR